MPLPLCRRMVMYSPPDPLQYTAVIVKRPDDPDTHESLLNYFERESSERKENYTEFFEPDELVKYVAATRVAEVRQRLQELGIPEFDIRTENLWERSLHPWEHLTEDYI